LLGGFGSAENKNNATKEIVDKSKKVDSKALGYLLY